ncbi:MAG: SDR family oxidoreductase [Pseudomonadota bacterium]|nr:SDR family oxidoreductase [Pseudomonadota bacterium]
MNKIDLDGKIAVVTGGARGIGYAISERFIQSGAKVALWDMDSDAMDKAVKELSESGTVIAQKVDVANEVEIAAALAATEKSLGGVDILVNNAGIAGPTVKLWEYTPADFRKVVDIDLVGPFLCCHAIVPGMMKRGYGRIVNIASIAGKEGNANASAYSAAKAGVIGLTKSLGKELANHGIIVNCITPAAAKTDIFKQISQQHIDFMLSKIPMGRFVEVKEIAAMAAWLASGDCSFTTGGVFDISGGRAVY